MKDEAAHYFNLAIKRLENKIRSPETDAHKKADATAVKSKDSAELTFFLLELLKEQVPHEDTHSSAR